MYNNGATGNSSDFLTGNNLSFQPDHTTILQAAGDRVELPDASFVRDADMSRDGMNLVLTAPDGSTVVIEGYFAAVPAPLLQAPDGSALTPELVQSFVAQPLQYADANGGDTATDESPVGAVQEVSGHATVTHTDGTVETIQIGTQIFQGDVVETDDKGAVNIMFVDETTFAVSEDARLAIDEYVYDPSTQSGSTNFSVLKGVFVFTSGMIGREDPDDVHIDTPVGSIGIRGTIIAGNVNSGEITVVEGAIVLKDFSGHEMTLASQFETARFNPSSNQIEHIGQMAAAQVVHNFSAVASVSPQLFSSINDSAKEAPANNGNNTQQNDQNGEGDNAQQPNQNGQGNDQPQDTKPGQSGDAGQNAPVQTATSNSSGLTGDSSGLKGNSSGLASGTTSGTTGQNTAQTGSTGSSGNNASSGTGTTTATQATKPAGTTNQQSSNSDQPPPDVIQHQANNTSGGTTGTGGTTIQPANVPPQITGITGVRAVAENTVTATEVARVQADSGNAGETLTYKLLSGQSFFDIDQNGVITTKAGTGLDYETAQTVDLQVEVSDGKDVTTQTIQVNITNVNEAPTALTIDNSNIDENSAAATVIGTLNTSDPDAGDTYTYSITNDPDGKFAIIGDQLVVNGALDFETASSHTVTVRTTDAGGLTHDQTFTINVNDITEVTNTAPTGTDNSSLNTNEDTALVLNGSDFGFSDIDVGDTLAAVKMDSLPANGTLFLNGTAVAVGDTIGVADINAGYLTFQPMADYNGSASFTFFVQDNQGAFSGTANTITMTVNAVNDAPILNTTVPQMDDIVEDGASAGQPIASFISAFATDIDGDPTNGIAITGIDDTNGTWEFSTDGGTTYTALAGISDTNALLLTDSDFIRFVPNADYNGMADFTFKAWDQTSGTIGSYADTTASTAFSTNDDTATINILPDATDEGTSGADTFMPTVGDQIDIYDGSLGTDAYDAANIYTNITVDLAAGKVNFNSETDSLLNIENIIGSAYNDTFIAADGTDSFMLIDGSSGHDIYDASGVTTNTISLDLSSNTVTIGSDTNEIYDFEEFKLGSAAGNSVYATDILAYDITIDATVGSYDIFDGSNITNSIIFDAASHSLDDSSGHYYQLNGFEQINVNGGTLNFSTAAGPVNVDLMLQKVTDNGQGDFFAFSGFDHISGSNYNDTIGLDYSSDQSVDAGYGNDVFTMGIDSGSHINTALSNDGISLSLMGGWGTDTISFTDSVGNNHYIIDADGTEDTIDSIEVFDFASNTANDTIDFSVNDEMFDNLNSAQKITIVIEDTDELNLDFTAYDNGGDFILYSADTSYREYKNTLTGDIVRVENTSAIWDNVHTTGLIDLELSVMIGFPSGFTQQGNVITDNIGLRFGGTFAAVGDTDGDGHDNLLIGRQDDDMLFLFNNPSQSGLYAAGHNLTSNILGGSPIDSLSYIGDFNGDGKADYIVGAPWFNGDQGKAVIVDQDGTILYELTGNASQYLGSTVVGVGDVNGDGYDDVLISAPGNGSTAGEATIVYGDYYKPVVNTNWDVTAASSNQQYQATVGGDGKIYVSQDSGVTWKLADAGHTGNWSDISISENGQHLAAVVSNGQIYVSHDSGATWTVQSSTIQNWSSVTISDNGLKLAATVSGGYIYTSTDGGANWTQTSSNSTLWTDITSSADGTKLAATTSGGYIYTSTNGGSTWTQQTSSGAHNWTSIAYSDTDNKLTAIDDGGNVYTSIFGSTWSPLTSIVGGTGLWNILDDGSILTATIGTQVYTSDDGGTTWISQTPSSTSINVVSDFDTATLGISDGYGDDGYGSIAAAGDFDGDGKQDIVLTNGTFGTVNIAFGGDLGSYTNYRSFSGISVDPTEKDIPVFNLGDINGDGIDDIAIAETGANSGNGAVHIIYGSTTANGSANIAAASNITIDTSGTSYAIVGGGSVGDFNGDGIDDMALAFKTPGMNERDVDIFVLYGGSDAMLSGTITMDDLLDNDNAFHMTYTIPGTVSDADNFDIEIGRAGDVNGDGLYDLAIGLPQNGSNGGTVAVVYGHTSDGMDVLTMSDLSSNTNDYLYAGSADQTLMGGQGDDVLDQSSSSYSDLVMLGGAGNDTFILADQNFNQIDGGSGTGDLIKFNSMTVDLSSFTGNDITRVETLSMEASNQTMTINLSTIMDLMNNSDDGNLSITASDMNSNLVIDTNQSGDSQITGGGSNTASQVKLALEDVFGDGNVEYSHDTTGGAGNQGVDHFTIGGHTLSIDSALIDTIVVTDA